MGVRVSLKLRVGRREVTLSALVNSGFESDSPDIAIPVNTARELGLWPQRA